MNSTGRLKLIFGLLAFILAFFSLSLPFRVIDQEIVLPVTQSLNAVTLENLKTQSGYELILPSFCLVLYIFVLLILFLEKSGRFISIFLSAANVGYLFIINALIHHDIAQYANHVYVGPGFYLLCISAILLIVASVLDFRQKHRKHRKLTTEVSESDSI